MKLAKVDAPSNRIVDLTEDKMMSEMMRGCELMKTVKIEIPEPGHYVRVKDSENSKGWLFRPVTDRTLKTNVHFYFGDYSDLPQAMLKDGHAINAKLIYTDSMWDVHKDDSGDARPEDNEVENPEKVNNEINFCF